MKLKKDKIENGLKNGSVRNIKRLGKYALSFSEDEKMQKKITGLLEKANQKRLGKKVTFKGLVTYALCALTNKDLEKIKEDTLGNMDKVKMHLESYNKKTGEGLDLGKFLVKKLKI